MKNFLYILMLLLAGCSTNEKLLQKSIEDYHADGGAYILYDMQNNKLLEKQTINYDLQQMYQPDFSKIGLIGETTAEQFLKQYIQLVKNDKDLQAFLRQNVLSGEARKVNVTNLEIFGITATTSKGQDKEVITTFLGHFIKDNKSYALIVLLDNPQQLKKTYGYRTAGWNVANLARELLIALTSKKY